MTMEAESIDEAQYNAQAMLRGERHPMTVVPHFEDTISALLKMFEDEDRQRAQVISTLPLVVTDGADSGW